MQDNNELVKRGKSEKNVGTSAMEWEKEWKWTKTQGADGWWQVLMQAVWVDGIKVLKNQAVVFDVSDGSDQMTTVC